MRPASLLAIGLLLATATGCMGAQSPAVRVQDVAREANTAARFGRMDVAMEHAASGTREQWMKRHASWGGAVRVFEMEFAGFSMPDSNHATVVVDFQWMRVDENMLRTTRVEQTWRGDTKDRGWKLTRERRIAGDVGLFGEVVARNDAPAQPRGDVQFPTRTIRAAE